MCQPCEHLNNYKQVKGFTSYKVLHAFYVVRLAKGSSQRKTLEVECCSCHKLASRIHACLHCVYFGCFHRHHIHKHAVKEKHSLAMDILSGNIFCFECKDYIYDEDFNAVARQQKQEGKIRGITSYIPWEPSEKEIALLKQHEFRKVKNDSHIGLRGLYNMGNTCYMNCIIQVLVHTPLLRDYFLADKHACIQEKDICWGCIMSDIFQEFFSGWTTTLSLETLLYVTWQDMSALFGSEMHDAQEFFSALLDALHSCEKKEVVDESDCACVIHQVFSGFSQSEIQCLNCGNLSTTISSFWDVNLDFGPDEISEPGHSESKLHLKNFIERYTRTEPLHSPCGSCGSVKRTIHVTFKKLPVVICFHFKRLRFQEPKISTQVLFPENLDMSPYLTTSKTSKIPEVINKDGIDDLDSNKNLFTLFAVVCHKGNDVGGHYFSYIRQHNSWYKCDDPDILKVDIRTMLNSEGYLLFYHKGILEYELQESNPRNPISSD